MTAIQHLGRAPGGASGAQIYKVAECEELFVVKLKGTAQGIRVLYNEYVSGRIGEFLEVPFGEHALVDVPEALHPPPGERNISQRLPGIQFGTVYYNNAQRDESQLRKAKNFGNFPSVLVFDTFIARGDSRQFGVHSSSGTDNGHRDTGVIFDQGFAFTGSPNWEAEKLNADNNCTANNGLQLKKDYSQFQHYEPYIEKVEKMTLDDLRAIANEPPLSEWKVSPEQAEAVACWLDRRRGLVRQAVQNYLR